VTSSSPHHECNERMNPWGLNIGHICNEINQGPTNEGGLSCAHHVGQNILK
jgi:hypothetical protein